MINFGQWSRNWSPWSDLQQHFLCFLFAMWGILLSFFTKCVILKVTIWKDLMLYSTFWGIIVCNCSTIFFCSPSQWAAYLTETTDPAHTNFMWAHTVWRHSQNAMVTENFGMRIWVNCVLSPPVQSGYLFLLFVFMKCFKSLYLR